MSVNPSALSSASAMYCGARQIGGAVISLSRVVSGGGAAPVVRGRLRTEAAPKADALARKLRRGNTSLLLSFTFLMALIPSVILSGATARSVLPPAQR